MARGDYEAALRLEQVWNDLARVHSFSLRCAYPKNGFHGTEHAAEFLEFAKSIRKLFLTEANGAAAISNSHSRAAMITPYPCSRFATFL